VPTRGAGVNSLSALPNHGDGEGRDGDRGGRRGAEVPRGCPADCGAIDPDDATGIIPPDANQPSTILQTCGNSLREGTETCDTNALNSNTCITVGFTGGILACNSTCTGFNTTACIGAPAQTCGNNIREGTETCDGTDLNAQTCIGRGYTSGLLSCAANCGSFVTASCSSGASQFLVPGQGWTGATAQPAGSGNASQQGFDEKAIARWDVVPFQSFDSTLNVGVVAFHLNDIDRVEFAVNGGPWTAVRTMSLNPHTNVNEYWATLRASDFPDGNVEVRAIAYPKIGVPRVLAGALVTATALSGDHSMWLYSNANHSLNGNTIYVKPSTGSDTNPGTQAAPVATIGKGLALVTDGGTVILTEAGRYAVMGQASKNNLRWITVKAADGISRDSIIISQGSRIAIRPFVGRAHWYGMSFDFHEIGQYYPENGEFVWFDHTKFYDSNGWGSTYLPFTTNSVRATVYIGGLYGTNVHAEEMQYGLTGFTLLRDGSMYKISGDSFQNSRLVINSTLDLQQIVICWTNPLGQQECTHDDVFQHWGTTQNVIVYGVTATNVYNSQNLFMSSDTGVPLQDVAVVNVSIENPGVGESGGSQIGGIYTHVLFKNLQMPQQGFTVRTDLGYAGKDILFSDCVLKGIGLPASGGILLRNCTNAAGVSIDGGSLAPIPPDSTAPSVPTNLSAVTADYSASLSWTASTDNVAVTGYKVFRNGAQIATTTTPSYADNGLSSSTQYTYAVSAYDAAGNNSAQSASISATTLPPASGSSAYWSFDQSTISSMTLADASGNNNTGTFAVSPSVVAGHTGEGVLFDGANQAVSFSNGSNNGPLNPSAAVSVAAWVNPSSANGAIVARGCTYSGPAAMDYALLFYANRFRLDISDANSVPVLLSPVTHALNAWYHVVAVYDGSTMKLFVNGSLEASQATAITHLNNTALPTGIGKDVGCTRSPFSGVIDEVHVYTRALSDAEAAALYAGGNVN
jgi:chitodextrinase